MNVPTIDFFPSDVSSCLQNVRVSCKNFVLILHLFFRLKNLGFSAHASTILQIHLHKKGECAFRERYLQSSLFFQHVRNMHVLGIGSTAKRHQSNRADNHPDNAKTLGNQPQKNARRRFPFFPWLFLVIYRT